MRREIRFPYMLERVTRLKAMSIGARWSPERRTWNIPEYAVPLVEHELNIDLGGMAKLVPFATNGHKPIHGLFDYQQVGVDFLSCWERAMLLDDMGLGKTAQAIHAVIRRDLFPCLIICPAFLKPNWEKEIAKWQPKRLSVATLEGINAQVVLTSYWHICNYEIIPSECTPSPRSIIIDEAHYIKEGRAKRTVAVRALVEKYDPAVYALTGTPLVNRPRELWPVLKIIDPRCPEFWDFARIFCAPYKNEEFDFWDTSGSANLDLLHRILKEVSLRRTHKDIIGEREAIITAPQWLELSLGLQKPYRQAERAFGAFLKANFHGQYVDPSKIKQFHTLRHILFEGKLSMLGNILENRNKAIIFCEYVDHVEKVRSWGLEQGVPISFFHGALSPHERLGIIEEFEARETGILVCTRPSGGEGFHLKTVDTVIFMDLPWTPKDLKQASARAWDAQVQRPVTVFSLIMSGTVDVDIWNILERKEEISGEVVEGKAKKDVLAALAKKFKDVKAPRHDDIPE